MKQAGVFHILRQRGVDDHWQGAKERKLCFRCLAADHRGKDCGKAHTCGRDGCPQNHLHLLHGCEKGV